METAALILAIAALIWSVSYASDAMVNRKFTLHRIDIESADEVRVAALFKPEYECRTALLETRKIELEMLSRRFRDAYPLPAAAGREGA